LVSFQNSHPGLKRLLGNHSFTFFFWIGNSNFSPGLPFHWSKRTFQTFLYHLVFEKRCKRFLSNPKGVHQPSLAQCHRMYFSSFVPGDLPGRFFLRNPFGKFSLPQFYPGWDQPKTFGLFDFNVGKVSL